MKREARIPLFAEFRKRRLSLLAPHPSTMLWICEVMLFGCERERRRVSTVRMHHHQQRERRQGVSISTHIGHNTSTSLKQLSQKISNYVSVIEWSCQRRRRSSRPCIRVTTESEPFRIREFGEKFVNGRCKRSICGKHYQLHIRLRAISCSHFNLRMGGLYQGPHF